MASADRPVVQGLIASQYTSGLARPDIWQSHSTQAH